MSCLFIKDSKDSLLLTSNNTALQFGFVRRKFSAKCTLISANERKRSNIKNNFLIKFTNSNIIRSIS